MVNGLPSKQKWLVRVWLFAMIQLRKLFRRFVNRYGANYIYLFVVVMYIPILFLSTWLDGKILPVYSTFFILGALFSLVIPATYIRYYNIYRILRLKYRKKRGKKFPSSNNNYWLPTSVSLGAQIVLLITSENTNTDVATLPLQEFSRVIFGIDSMVLLKHAPAPLITVRFS